MKNFKFLNVTLVIVLMTTILTGCGSKNVSKSTQPITLNIIDVSGSMQLVGDSIDQFKAANPDLIGDVVVKKSTALEVPSLLKAQILSEDMKTNLIFTGIDGLSTCIDRDVIENIMPTYGSRFPDLESNYSSGAKATYDLVKGYAITYVYSPSGPFFTYNPDTVQNIPKTPDELLAFAKANPGKFTYARPAGSGPGRIFLQGLPYILGDKDPKDPKTWDKTWAYLKELNQYIDYYPAKTGTTFTELKAGKRSIIASQLGWDMNQRIIGGIPQTYQGFVLNNTTLVADAQYMAIPKGLSDEQKNVVLKLMAWLMTPKMQAITYDSGYFYPGPSVKNVSLDMAPKESQDKIKPAIRQSYEDSINTLPNSTQLDTTKFMDALNMWDQLFGTKVKR
ncbi:MAG: extracellular solute-binding protein [Clostridium beijerinckii]|jgi:putative spermidine/putrescine transport system substrate-binding protein|uniref:extracellular solute-binding protein n=1 Tax=Clostridium diolis TaxID=223919 RepID=UPI003AF6D500|nr:extracellular solute-binding protein [Clostridium beijerinckii]MCI1578498.1 extracellular solute-binding protein [Clostridium beijerinckii]MCI1586034.1 extracellular solute-binding protein [Clostridium beijerinckii]MCI1621570.1 extracellular solute-binding protein [Clostridium beijerinckii]